MRLLLLLLSACLGYPALTAADDSGLAAYVDRQEVAGLVAVAHDRKGAYATVVAGYADRSRFKTMRDDTLFWVASQTKAMTAAAVMMLVDEGRLSLDDPVEKHLPEFKDQKVAGKDGPVARRRSITVRDLLSHVSGLPFKSPEEQPTLDGLPLERAVKTYARLTLQTQPGEKYQYSNAGINTAARILEVVSGTPYAEFMQRRLFAPLGMKDATFWPDERQVARLAKTYRPVAKDKPGLAEGALSQLGQPLGDRKGRFAMPAGGLFATADDVARFCLMLLNGGEHEGRRILSAAAVAAMISRQTPAGMKESYGLGLTVGPDSFGHGGAQATHMEVIPSKGVVLIWMVQHQGFPGQGGRARGTFQQWALRNR
ncbi:MAG: serine hydrolase domain-containing protein [Opitutales bacterium]